MRRYNGKSHQHTNKIEGNTFFDFHIHQATERYQEFGERERVLLQRQPSVTASTEQLLLEALISDCGSVSSGKRTAGTVYRGECVPIQAIEAEFKQKVCDEISLHQEGVDRYRVLTPFCFDDGDHLCILLKRSESHWLLTDEGHTFMHLYHAVSMKRAG
ncbi:MAG: DUF1828 domain-containing protein [Planctomycetota bacterium]|nr:DUF1828 domain-containing protein [Planctomycetota bacterium]